MQRSPWPMRPLGAITNANDYNRDGNVDVTDKSVAGTHFTNVYTALQLISVPNSLSLVPAPQGSGSGNISTSGTPTPAPSPTPPAPNGNGHKPPTTPAPRKLQLFNWASKLS